MKCPNCGVIAKTLPTVSIEYYIVTCINPKCRFYLHRWYMRIIDTKAHEDMSTKV